MPENYHSPWHWTNKAGRTAEGQLLYQIEQQRTQPTRPAFPPSGGVELGAFGKKFVGFGLILLGLWLSPAPEASGEAWILPGGLLLIGGLGFLKGIRESWGFGWQPFAGRRGAGSLALRGMWALRPRIWMLAWAAIIAVFVFYGSPHLRMAYGPGGCDYFGLNGAETFGVAGRCPLVKAFPLD